MTIETIYAMDKRTYEITSYKKASTPSNPLIIGIGATNAEALEQAFHQLTHIQC